MKVDNKEQFAFKIVCVDENDPIEYKILDDINKDNITEVCQYLKSHYTDYDMNNCKWIILPICKNKQIK